MTPEGDAELARADETGPDATPAAAPAVDSSAADASTEPAAEPTPDAASEGAPEPTRTTAHEVQQAWRAHAADLGGRNTLLWHRDLPLGTIELTVVHPAGVAKLLAGKATRLTELVRESVALEQAHRRVNAIRAKMTELSDEHGLTTGFLAVGMATWQLPRAPVPPRAPVLLRECRIDPVDEAHTDFVLQLDNAVLLNPVLVQYLRGEVGLTLDPPALAALSTQGSGFDARPTYQALEQLCREVPGFSIGPQLIIETFPLAKLPFVAEYAAGPGRFDEAPLVAELARAEAGAEPHPRRVEPLETSGEPSGEAVTVLPADSAQQATAVLAQQQTIVLDAAPGTGRTQVVVNALAGAVADGQSCLVLAESAMARSGLRARLAEAGLDHLVLDLGETPTGARRAARQLRDSLAVLDGGNEPAGAPGSASEPGPRRVDADRGDDDPDDRPADPAAAMAVLREHHRCMHQARDPWGVSLSRAQNELTELAGRSRPPHSHVRLDKVGLRSLTLDRLAEVTADLTEAATVGAWRRGRGDDPWYGAALADDAEATRAGEIVQRLVTGDLDQARTRMREVCRRTGLPEPLNVRQWRRHLDLLDRVQDTLDVFVPQVYEAPLKELLSATGQGGQRPSAMARSRLRRQARGLLRPGRPPADLHAALAEAARQRLDWEELAGRAARPSAPAEVDPAAEEFETIERDLAWLEERLAGTPSGKDLQTTHLDLLLERMLRLDARADRLPVAARSHALLHPLREAGLGALIDDLARRGVPAEDVAAEVALVFWASVHDRISSSDGSGERARLEAAVSEVLRGAEAARAAAGERVRRAVGTAAELAAADPEARGRLADRLDRVLSARLTGRGATELRGLIGSAPQLVAALRPIWLASPLVVPATVPDDVRLDLVVALEAQALPVAEAVPALARGARALVVGQTGGPGARPFVTVADPRAEQQLRDVQRGTDLLTLAGRVWPTVTLEVGYAAGSAADDGLAGLPAPERAPVDGTDHGTDDGTESVVASPLIADLVQRLRAEGLGVRERVGRPPHQIALVIDDPDHPGAPLLAVDTDADPEAPVPSHDTVVVRLGQLTRLGWTPARVWTTEVFRDPAREVARLAWLARAASNARHDRSAGTRS